MNDPRKLLADVVQANAPYLLSADPRERRAAMACVLASADDYAESRHTAVLPADLLARAEAERLRAGKLNGDHPLLTSARRHALAVAITGFDVTGGIARAQVARKAGLAA